MPMDQSSLGLGRVGLKKVYTVEAQKVDPQWKAVVGRVDHTTQSFEIYKQLAGLAPSEQTDEGQNAAIDQMYPIFSQQFAPVLMTKMVSFTYQTAYTDQYGQLKNLQPEFARAFMQKRNIYTSNLDNLGFTDTTYGVNNETLYSTSHSMGGNQTFSNRPSPELALSPTALQTALTQLRQQTSARGTPQPITGRLILKVPNSLEFKAAQILSGMYNAFSGDFTTNVVKERVTMTVNDYYNLYGSNYAWFLRAENNSDHGLFFLEQMGYDIMQLAPDQQLMHKWAAFESYIVGWYDAHGTWGTTGQ